MLFKNAKAYGHNCISSIRIGIYTILLIMMRPRQQPTIDQQYLTIARPQTGCSQREVATELNSTLWTYTV